MNPFHFREWSSLSNIILSRQWQRKHRNKARSLEATDLLYSL